MLKKTIKAIVVKSSYYRNIQTMGKKELKPKRVNIEWWDYRKNLGDCLAPVIVDWMLERKGIDSNKKIKKTKHLYTVGSVIGMGRLFDATIWGSGIHTLEAIDKIGNEKDIRKYDIRAVRGPKTAKVMRDSGYNCPDVYGDPAILMPLIYSPENVTKEYKLSVIHHYLKKNNNDNALYHELDIETDDYKKFIDELCKSELVISSSLHGIILAESYGIPCFFLNEGLDDELFKFYDWYESTGRDNLVEVSSIEAAFQMEFPKIPDLSCMRERLLAVFPYDLWQ